MAGAHGVRARPRAGRRTAAALALLLLGTTLAAGCGGEGAESTPQRPREAAPSTTAAPLIPKATELPTELPPSDQFSADASELAQKAEKLAQQAPPQERPGPVTVARGSSAWQPGVAYRGVFADPDIVRHGDTWYAYGTNTSHLRLPTLVSKDLSTWTPVRTRSGGRYDPLPRVGAWVTNRGGGQGLWAPSVARIGDGWTAAYSAQRGTNRGERHNCIGLARGDGPVGPFEPVGEPICHPEANLGIIDPDLYVDSTGLPWLLWKFSGIAGVRPAGLFIRQLDEDGTAFADGSETLELLRKEHAWEGRTIENPSMVEFRGTTYLFYSGNSWKTAGYATGYAVCSGPDGPCVRPEGGAPLLTTASTGHLGPGGASAFVDGDSLRLIYHAWEPGRVMSLRTLHVAGLWQREDGTLEVVHPG